MIRFGTAPRYLLTLALGVFALLVNNSVAIGRHEGNSDARSRRDAIAAIPLAQLRPDQRQRIQSVVSKPTIYRRLPVETIDCDAGLFTFLLRNPEVVVGIWQDMGLTQLQLQRRGTYTYDAQDGMGTISRFQLQYGTPRLHLYYGTGYYEGSLIKHKIRGECVLLIRTVEQPVEGRVKLTNVVDAFVSVDNAAVDLAGKTLYPFFIRSADENLTFTARFVGQLSRSTELRGDKIMLLAERLPNVSSSVKRAFMAHIQRLANNETVSPVFVERNGAVTSEVAPARFQRVEPSIGNRSPLTVSRFPPDVPRMR